MNMTDRTQHFTVILDESMRVDDARRIADAISLLSGVKAVEVGIIPPGDALNNRRAQIDLTRKVLDFINEG